MIQSLLIANRGEIACRIRRTALAMTLTAALPLTSPALAQSCNIALANANIWTGAVYEKRSIGIRDGRFTTATDGLPVVEASFLYFIPPFADAHNHRIDTPYPGDTTHARALAQGIYYALNPNNIRAAGPTRTGQAGLVDLQATGGGLTRPGGHPQPLYEGLIKFGVLGPLKAEDLPGQAFHNVSTPAETRAAVARVKANGASLIKLYLLDHDRPDGGDGLSAAIFAVAVAEAKKLGLTPIVHIENAADFRLAVAAKVHAVVHMPYFIGKDRDPAQLMITAKDATLAAANKVHVVPTVAVAHGMYDGDRLVRMQAVMRHNLTLLRDAKVSIGLGADQWNLTLHDEMAYMRALGLFSGADMLTMATTNGAQIAFPGRKIGKIADGYEASFLAWYRPLPGAWSEARDPAMGMREGQIMADTGGFLAKACTKADSKP